MADFDGAKSRIRSKSVPNCIANNTEEEDDAKKTTLKTSKSPPLKIDLSTLKNEILTDGVQVSYMG